MKKNILLKTIIASAAMLMALAALVHANVFVSRAISRSDSNQVTAAKHCEFCMISSAEAANSDAKSSNGITLKPKLFVGPVRQGYKIAEEKPDLLAQLHCYCGCDKRHGHKSLLDCYKSRHSASCETCVGEAIMANRMFDQGSPVEQIKAALKTHFENAE